MNSKLEHSIKNLITLLEKEDLTGINAVLGVDGFVDEIIHPVKTRENIEKYNRIKTIEDFGKRIMGAAGLSTNIELVPTQVKLGGNGPIMCNSLIEYGNQVTYFGALGSPVIHSVFKDMSARCKKVISIADPGHTDALEFDDGKLMLGKLESLKDVNWDNVKKEIKPDELAAILEETDLLGLENWTMVPYMNEIWEGLIKEVFPLIEKKEKRRIAFFDLADPEKRTNESILKALELISEFSPLFKVILGLNMKEAVEISEVLGLEIETDVNDDYYLEKLTTEIYQSLDIYCLVVHPVDKAAACINGEYYQTEGPYTPEPKLTTGAGDNFNAGFCLGQTLGFPVEESLILGTATSGFYVRNAGSPTKKDVLGFLNSWLDEKI